MGINTITDFLQKKGVKSDGSPNALVDAETYALLEKEFGAGRAVNSERVNIRERIAQKQATVTLDDDAKGKGGKNDEELLVKSNVISVKDEVASMGPKILGKIDLSGKGPKAAPAATPAPAPRPAAKPAPTPAPAPAAVPAPAEPVVPTPVEVPEPQPAAPAVTPPAVGKPAPAAPAVTPTLSAFSSSASGSSPAPSIRNARAPAFSAASRSRLELELREDPITKTSFVFSASSRTAACRWRVA